MSFLLGTTLYERCELDDIQQVETLEKLRQITPAEEATAERPLKGGTIWQGKEDAWEATVEVFNLANRGGRLQAITDAIRSSRTQDDFSSRWSTEKEDFERKFYHKRNKTKIIFRELHDTVPVHGPESEIHEQLYWQDFLSILNPKEKSIVVCIRSGDTSMTDIAKKLGYKTHSPVSKAMVRIRRKAHEFLK